MVVRPIVQLGWNPVNTSAFECSNSLPDIQYCVSYRCCNGSSWNQTICTPNTSIQFEEQCDTEYQAVFSVQVHGNNYSSYLVVNLQNNTGKYVYTAKQMNCFTTELVCCRQAEETVVICITYFANYMRQPERKLPRPFYNHDLAHTVTAEHL